MSVKQNVLTSFFSCLLTLVAVFAFLAITGVAGAQQPQPPAGNDPAVAPVAGNPAVGAQPSSPLKESAAAAVVYVHYTGSAFTPLYGSTDPHYVAGGCTYSGSASSTDAFMNMAVVLPPGSAINSLRFYYNDAAPTDTSLRIRQMVDGQDFYSDVAIVSSTGSTGLGYNTVSGLNYVVDYENYSYVLQYNASVAGATMQLCGARIGYTPPAGTTFLPHVSKSAP